MLGKKRRIALLAEGSFTPLDAKTAVGVLRYRPEQVAAVIDSTRAGTSVQEAVGFGGSIPVVADIEAAAARGADALLIGVAPQGGELPSSWRAAVHQALDRGWDVLAGLHVFLADDPEFGPKARARGVRIHDVRRPPSARRVASRRAANLDALVVLTVGSDCNVGKMTTALEVERSLARRGRRAAFVATGQTGIFIADRGAAVDAVPSDFVAGTVEALVEDAAHEAEFVLVEGQGALHHPGYSGVTLGLLHGACPRAMILCHQAGRERGYAAGRREAREAAPAIPPLRELVEAYERAAAWVSPGRVTGVALNTLGLAEADARRAVRSAENETGLPATDPVRFGADVLAEGLEVLAGRDRATLG